MPSTDRKLDLKAKKSVAQTGSQPYVYAKGLNRLWWFGHVQRMEGNRTPKRICKQQDWRVRPRNRWQDEVREDGRIVGGEEWQEKYITERNGRSS
jgi:hypothetical protein